jgi:hypothetical protein
MIRQNTADAEPAGKEKLPLRDWIRLPTLGLFTICLIAGCVEWGARRMFARLPTAGENCLAVDDPSRGARGIPNCVVSEKIPEGELTEYRFNSSGYRNNTDFGPKPPSTYRIVIVGTSVAAGFRVPQAQTIGALLPAELARRTGRKVEVYNEGLPLRSSSSISLDFKDALAANPDMILWIVSPLDISYSSIPRRTDEARRLNTQAGLWHFLKAAFSTEWNR